MTIKQRILECLTAPDPPPTYAVLCNRLQINPNSARNFLKELVTEGTLTSDQIPWRRRVDVPQAAHPEGSPEVLRQQIKELQDQVSRLSMARTVPKAQSREDLLLVSLIRIVSAAGRDLTARAVEKAFPPHAILSAQEEALETQEGSNMAGASAGGGSLG